MKIMIYILQIWNLFYNEWTLSSVKKKEKVYNKVRGWKPPASSVYQPYHIHSILSISHQKTSPRIHFNAWAMTLKAIAGSVISRNFYNLFNNTPHRILYRKIAWPSKLTPRGFCTLWHMIEFDIPCSYLVLSCKFGIADWKQEQTYLSRLKLYCTFICSLHVQTLYQIFFLSLCNTYILPHVEQIHIPLGLFAVQQILVHIHCKEEKMLHIKYR